MAQPEGLTAVRTNFVRNYRAIAFILPLAIFMVATSLEPIPPEESLVDVTSSTDTSSGDGVKSQAPAAEKTVTSKPVAEQVEASPNKGGVEPNNYHQYPWFYSAKIGLTIFALWFVWPVFTEFPVKISPWAFLVGVLGVVVWILLAELQRNSDLWANVAWDSFGKRSAFNPLKELSANPNWAYVFLAIRFLGLAIVVPIIEELFLRGFLMRFVMEPNWEKVPFGQASALALVVGTAFPMLSHPGELLAAAVWFSAVSWLMVKTKSYWDCVVAHGITNLLLGIYVVTTGNWYLM